MRRGCGRRDRARREDPSCGCAREPADGRADHGPLDAGAGTGPRQVEIFEQEGVELARVQIAHCGDTDDVDYVEGLIERGVYAGLDRYGLEMFLPIGKRNATTAELLQRGHAERVMLSQDFCATIDWFPPEADEVFAASGAIRNWSMTLVFDEVVPALRELGVLDDATFDTIFVQNPRRWLVVD